MRSPGWGAWTMVAVAAMGVLPAFPSVAHTGTVLVVQTAVEQDDGLCSLREAIEAANTDAIADGCPAGDESDTIFVPPGTYRSPIEMVISESVSIHGAQGGATVVEGLGHHGILAIDAGATVMLSNLTLTGGRSGSGGAIHNAGDLTITNALLTGNEGSGGGAIFNGGTLLMRDSTVTHNRGADGGGITTTGPMTISRSVISDNYATIWGGAIRNNYSAGTARIIASTISGNRSGSAGGAIWNDGNLSVVRSALVRNESNGGGGAIATPSDRSSLVLSHSTVSQNVGRTVLEAGRGTTAINYSTIVGNDGGLWGEGTTLARSIVASNGERNCGISVIDGKHNLVWPDASCPGVRADPKLGPLADNGGPTLTHALLAGSAALNRVPSRDAACDGTDQRGKARPYGPGCDSGAYEHRRTASRTTLSPNLRADSIGASGAVIPDHRNASVSVSLHKFTGDSFVRVARKRVPLDSDSRYRTSFARPRATRCRLRAVFGRDFDHEASSASRTFDC